MKKWDLAILSFLNIVLCVYSFYGLNSVSLWHDEAWVANSILTPSLREMLYYTEPTQSTPLGILLTVRLFTSILGEGEWVFRLLSVICGIISLNLLFILGKKFSGNTIGGIFSSLFYLTNLIILRYNKELKQYSQEFCVTLFILYIASKLDDYTIQKGILFLGTSIFVLFYSNNSMFISLTVLFSLAIQYLMEKKYKTVIELSILGFIYLTFCGLYYHYYLQDKAKDPMLQQYWKFGYPDSLEVSALIKFTGKSYYEFCAYFFGNAWNSVAWLFPISLIILILKNKLLIWIPAILVPIGLLGLAMMKVYPFVPGSRMFIFYFPFLILSLGALFGHPFLQKETEKSSSAFGKILQSLGKRSSLILTGLFIIAGLYYLGHFAKHQWKRVDTIYDYEPVKQYYEILQKEYNPNEDRLYVYYNSWFTFSFYNRINRWKASPAGGYEQYKNVPNLRKTAERYARNAKGKKLFTLITRPFPVFEENRWEDEILEEEFSKYCKKTREHRIQTGKIKNGVLFEFQC